jgi:hypothetical protein
MTSTTDTHANNGSGPEGIKPSFNALSKKGVHEVEIKALVQDNDRSVYDRIERFFASNGYTKLSARNKQLQTRQLDTIDRAMLKKGKTLRVRGECTDGDLNKVLEADICLKDEKTMTAAGAVKRNEYEARIRSFETATLRPLLEKYSKDEHPDLHKTLHSLRVRELREHFRIDCIRNRYVIELPEAVTGIKDKRFVAELILDDVAFVMDLPGRRDPLVYHHDLEVECEVLFKPCSYDANPEAAREFVSDPGLTSDEVDQGMRAIKRLLDHASGHRLDPNQDSKAERGFNELDKTLAVLRDYLTANDNVADTRRLTSAFSVSARNLKAANQNGEPAAQEPQKPLQPAANEDRTEDRGGRLHKHLPRDMGHVLRERAIARRPLL